MALIWHLKQRLIPGRGPSLDLFAFAIEPFISQERIFQRLQLFLILI